MSETILRYPKKLGFTRGDVLQERGKMKYPHLWRITETKKGFSLVLKEK